MIGKKNRFIDKIKSIVHLFLLFIISKNKKKFLFTFKQSNSQLHQDLFVLSELEFKSNGFFVEFGACDGRYYSNSLMLEKFYNWKGLLSEPCKRWHSDLKFNRSAKLDFRCVWKQTGEFIDFFEDINDPALSLTNSMDSQNLQYHNHVANDNHSKYSVSSVSLNDLLSSNYVPHYIDFLSIDTEGSEFEILNSFDFSNYIIKIICVEHNYSTSRDDIYRLLTEKGYSRKYKYLSRFDDWYVLD